MMFYELRYFHHLQRTSYIIRVCLVRQMSTNENYRVAGLVVEMYYHYCYVAVHDGVEL